MDANSELSFLNKKSSYIPMFFKIEQLDKKNQRKIKILKEHLFKSHKIITDIIELQIINNVLVFNEKGIITKSKDITSDRIDDVIAYILNSLHIVKIEK